MRVPAFGEEKDTFMKLPQLLDKWSKRGITINCNCTQDEFLIQRETIIFVATWQMNGASIECAATNHDTGDIYAFKYSNSNFAMLTVESEGASETENSSFTRPEDTTSASDTEESEGASGTEDSIMQYPLLITVLCTLFVVWHLCTQHHYISVLLYKVYYIVLVIISFKTSN